MQSGALAMDDLRDASLGAGEGIMGTYEATASNGKTYEERFTTWQQVPNFTPEPAGNGSMRRCTSA